MQRLLLENPEGQSFAHRARRDYTPPDGSDRALTRRRRFSTELKLAVVAETMQPGMSISYVARQHGLSPSLVFRWRRLMSEGGKEAVPADDAVVPASEVRRLEERVHELEYQNVFNEH
jgi:transposase-like protein